LGSAYFSRQALTRTCWVMGDPTTWHPFPSSSRSVSGPLSPIYAARQQLRAIARNAPITTTTPSSTFKTRRPGFFMVFNS
ncbi:hypothetical protein, partial [Archangium sp.]|uniref:hypothetical protein n=1 Tax=Archangium sp. TaxID=1872627 RepID=UPI002D2DDA29